MGGIVFSTIGFVVFMYGKRQANFKKLWIGVALMGYTYFVSNTILLYLVGVGLVASLFIFRD